MWLGHDNLKALCHYIRHNCLLMSSLKFKNSIKVAQELHVRALRTSRYSPWKCTEIDRVQCKVVWHYLRMSSWQPYKLRLWVVKRVRILISKVESLYIRCLENLTLSRASLSRQVWTCIWTYQPSITPVVHLWRGHAGVQVVGNQPL